MQQKEFFIFEKIKKYRVPSSVWCHFFAGGGAAVSRRRRRRPPAGAAQVCLCGEPPLQRRHDEARRRRRGGGRAIRFSKILSDFCSRGLKHFVLCLKGLGISIRSLTHSFLTAKQLFPGFFTFFSAIFKILRPEHDCYAKFTSCSTWRKIKSSL